MTDTDPMSDNVYLTGFMGSGKSTVGPLVAEQLGAAFVDLDAAIEETVGRPIAQVFAEQGEDAFREAERAALRATTSRSGLVVATGGGALLAPEAFDAAAGAGTVVFLRVQAEVLVARLAPEAAHRPLLHNASGIPLEGEALAQRIASLLAAREAAYERAHVVVQADDLPPALLARWVVMAVADISATRSEPNAGHTDHKKSADPGQDRR
ncbi:MAG: shikimate kinase [Bacteroidota bacterium]